MENNTIVNLPLSETIKRSYLFFMLHLKSLLKISAWGGLILVVYKIAYSSSFFCDTGNPICDQTEQRYYLYLIYLISTLVGAAYCRLVLLREESQSYIPKFDRHDLRYCGVSLLILGIILVVAFLLGWIALSIAHAVGFGTSEMQIVLIIAMIPLMIFGIRFYLLLPGIATGDKISIRDVLQMTNGNAIKIFAGLLVSSIPGLLLFAVWHSLNSIFVEQSNSTKLGFAIIAIIINFIDVGFKAAFYSHTYQFLSYFQKKQRQENEAK